jgi:hypothetical protein
MLKSDAERFRHTGLPASDSIVAEIEFTSPKAKLAGATGPAPAARTYTILRTTETDGYEADLAPGAVPRLGAPAPPGDDFRGTARRRAKTSLSSAAVESFADLAGLIGTLPAHAAMAKRKISKSAASGRVSLERRNVRIAAFLYAASREDDNDYHLIVGRDPAATPPLYMTIEVSGLPPSGTPHQARLRAARTAYKSFFGANLPGTSYDFYTPPIPVEVEGSLFWDASHATGSRPGPNSLRPNMPVVWELHPLSKIDFEP